MIVLTNSQQAAANNPSAEPFTIVEWSTAGGVFRLSTDTIYWSGQDYDGRLLDGGRLNVSILGGETGIVTAKTLTLKVADAEGFFLRKPPEYFKGFPLTVKEIFRDVQSDAARVFTFTVTNVDGDYGVVTVHGSDPLTAIRRRKIPERVCNPVDFPNAPAESMGKPYPYGFGRCLSPALFVGYDANSDGYANYVMAVGTGHASGQYLYQEWQDQLIIVDGVGGSDWYPPTHMFALADGTPYVRLQVNADSVIVADPNGTPYPLYGDVNFRGYLHTPCLPSDALQEILGDPSLGTGAVGFVVDSAALTAAGSYFAGIGHEFNAVWTEQRPVEDWLGDLSHDGLMRLVLRDKLIPLPVRSLAPVGSFTAANIIEGTLRFEDVALGSEESLRSLTFHPNSTKLADTQVVSWSAGSGAQVDRTSSFLGLEMPALRVVQYYSKREATGPRTYFWDSPMSTLAVEEGDIVTMTHSMYGLDGVTLEIMSTDRLGGRIGYAGRVLDYSAFQFESTSGPVPGTVPHKAARVFYSAGSQSALAPGFIFTSSHTLGEPPIRARIFTTAAAAPWWTSSLIYGANSSFTIHLLSQNGAYANVATALQYIMLYTY